MNRSLLETLESRRLLSASLRIAAWNIEDDIGGYTTPRSGVDTVIEGIGQESVAGTTRPVDILALEETTSNDESVSPIVDDLNSLYGSGTYAMSTFQGTEVGGNPGTGNGPSALIYNDTTVSLLASVGVGAPAGSANGEYRQVIRYEFQPIGGVASEDFYVYVAHAKSGTGTTNAAYRGEEAAIVRDNEATLPANSRVLYMGDLNSSTTSETYYQNYTAAGQGQAFDPENPTNSDPGTSPAANLLTESSTSLEYRDDYQLMTSNVLNDSANGLSYVSGSYHAFGNNGSIASGGDLTSSSNTALSGLADRAAVIAALGTASDHVPVVADYNDTLAPAANSNSIVAWDMVNQTHSGVQALAPNKVNVDVTTVENLTRGNGVSVSASAPSGAWGGTGWASTAAAGSSSHKTINFALTVDSDAKLSLSALSLNYRRDASGPTAVRVQYQLHGGAWTTLTTAALPSSNKHGSSIAPINIAAVPALQNLAGGTSVNFRLIPYGATSTAAGFYIYNEKGSDLEISGVATATA